LLERVENRRAEERCASREHFIEDHAQGINIGQRPDLADFAAGLLGAM